MKRKYLLVLASGLLAASCAPSESSSVTGDGTTQESESTSSSSSSSQQAVYLDDSLLDSISGNLLLVGNGTFTHESEYEADLDYTSTLSVSYNEESYYSLERLSNGANYESRVVKRGDYPYTYYVDANNELVYTRVEDASSSYTWDHFANPFKSLTGRDFRETSVKGTFMIPNRTTIKEVSQKITGYGFDFNSLRLVVEDGAISEIQIKGEGKDSYDSTLLLDFTFEISSTTHINDSPAVYERSSLHDYYDAAAKATKESEFTITHTDHHDIYGDTVYKFYFTKDAIYYAYIESGDIVPYGYVKEEAGLSRFTNSASEGLLRQYTSPNLTIADYYPSYDGFNSTILKPVSQTRFESYGSDNASIIGGFVCESADESITAKSAQNVSIELKDGKIKKITYFYSILGGFTEGTVTMDFDYSPVEIPLDFSTMVDAPQE